MKSKKPRHFAIKFCVGEDTAVDGFALHADGTMYPTLHGRPIQLQSTSVEVSYARPKGRKVLLSAPVDPTSPSIDPVAHFDAYDAIFAIDTNSREIGPEVVSVACMIRCKRRSPKNAGPQWEWETVGAIEFRGARVDPERIGWKVWCRLS
jgi:hypothetical protein